MRREPGQPAGSGVAFPVATEQKAFVAVPGRPGRQSASRGCDRGLIFGLIRLRSSTFIGIRINAAMQVTDLNGIQ